MGSLISIVVSPCAPNGARCAPFVRSGSDIRRFQVDEFAAPEVLRPADGEVAQIDGIGFEWRAVPFALNYRVCLKREQFAKECDSFVSVQAITVFARPDSALDLSGFAGETIFWNVAACVSSNCGLPSPARSLKVAKVRGRDSKLLDSSSEPSKKVPKTR